MYVKEYFFHIIILEKIYQMLSYVSLLLGNVHNTFIDLV